MCSLTSVIAPQVAEQVRLQIEYYFSVDNLVKDVFLRSKMDDQGWIATSVSVSACRRMCWCRFSGMAEDKRMENSRYGCLLHFQGLAPIWRTQMSTLESLVRLQSRPMVVPDVRQSSPMQRSPLLLCRRSSPPSIGSAC